jgi:hypothetical protein
MQTCSAMIPSLFLSAQFLSETAMDGESISPANFERESIGGTLTLGRETAPNTKHPPLTSLLSIKSSILRVIFLCAKNESSVQVEPA